MAPADVRGRAPHTCHDGAHPVDARLPSRCADEIDRRRAVEVTAKDLWERHSGHGMEAPEWRAPQERFWAPHAALETANV
jgi:hypothetical protein